MFSNFFPDILFGCFVTAHEKCELLLPYYYAVKYHDDGSGLEVKYKTIAERSVTGDNDIIAVPYNFEPNGLWSSSEGSDSDDTSSKASFTE